MKQKTTMKVLRIGGRHPHERRERQRGQEAERDHEHVGEDHPGEDRVDRSGCLSEQQRAGLDPVDEEGAHHHGRGRAARDAERQQVDHGAARRAVDRALGGDEPAGVPRAEQLGRPRDLLLEPVGRRTTTRWRRRPRGRPPRCPPRCRAAAASGAATGRAAGSRGTARRAAGAARRRPRRRASWSSTSPIAKSPMSTVTKSTPGLEERHAEGEALDAVLGLGADRAEEHPGEQRDQRRRASRRLAEHATRWPARRPRPRRTRPSRMPARSARRAGRRRPGRARSRARRRPRT